MYTEAYGDLVYAVEYTDAQTVPFEEACSSYAGRPGFVLRDRELVPSGADGYVERTCP